MRELATTCLCCLLMAPSLTGQQPAARSADETAVRDVVRKYVDARELRDARAIEALFTSDADQQTTSGEWRRGRAQIVPGTLESSRRNAGTRAISVESVRFLTPDVALVDGPYEIGAAGGPGAGAGPRRMRTTIVLARASGQWRIAAIRNMVPTRVP
jgi:uncharacterized protein (TIGR02246 family)